MSINPPSSIHRPPSPPNQTQSSPTWMPWQAAPCTHPPCCSPTQESLSGSANAVFCIRHFQQSPVHYRIVRETQSLQHLIILHQFLLLQAANLTLALEIVPGDGGYLHCKVPVEHIQVIWYYLHIAQSISHPLRIKVVLKPGKRPGHKQFPPVIRHVDRVDVANWKLLSCLYGPGCPHLQGLWIFQYFLYNLAVL